MPAAVARATPSPLNLQTDRLSVPYRERLASAGARFLAWCVYHHIDVVAAAASADDMNRILVPYLQHAYDVGLAYWMAPHTVLFVQTEWRGLKGHLRLSWDSVATWRLTQPVRSRVPLRVEVMIALCYVGLVKALVLDPARSPLWLAFASLLRLGFFGLFRPKELFNLRGENLMVPRPGTHARLQCVVASISDPKNRAVMGRVQVRLVRDPVAVQWAAWYAAGVPDEGLLWPFGPAAFARALRDSLRFLGLENFGWTAGSLRAGGATALLEAGTAVSNIRFAGGWSNDRTLSAYLQEAESAAVGLRFTQVQSLRLERFLASFSFLDATPPRSFHEIREAWTQSTSRAHSPPRPSLS
jgi:hypothetical protein